MTNHEKKLHLENLLALREWQKKYFPIIGSFAAYDMAIQLAIAHARNEPITVKQIFASPHSYTAIRFHYKKFLQNDLIYLLDDPNDKRLKHIRPTIKFNTFINDYLSNIKYIDLQKNSEADPPTFNG